MTRYLLLLFKILLLSVLLSVVFGGSYIFLLRSSIPSEYQRGEPADEPAAPRDRAAARGGREAARGGHAGCGGRLREDELGST